MENEKRNNKGKYLVIALVAIIAVVGVTYAFITITKQGTKENSITGGSLKVALNDTNEDLGNGAGDISITDAFPVTDAVGQKGTPYTFLLSNDGDKDASYTVYLDDDAVDAGSERMLDSQVKVYLEDGTRAVLKAATKVSDLYSASTGGTKVTRTVNGTEVQSSVLYSGVLPHGQNKTFVLRMWIADDADETVMGKQYATKVSVDAVQVPEYAVTISYPSTETIPATEEGGTATTKAITKMVSQAVFKSGTAHFDITDIKVGTGAAIITCTPAQEGENAATVAADAEVSGKITVDVPNVTAHTTCTISYTE